MKVRYDFHLHSLHSCDSASISMKDLIKETAKLGIEEFVVTDHLHTQYNWPDIVSSYRDYLTHTPAKNFHFGVEASCMGVIECEMVARGEYTAWGDVPTYGFRNPEHEKFFDGRMCIALDELKIRECNIEWVVGGAHWPLGHAEGRKEAIQNIYEQMIFLASHPLVNVLAHPWYVVNQTAGGFFATRNPNDVDEGVFFDIPDKLNDNIATTLLKYGKLAEINFSELFSHPDDVIEYQGRMFRKWRDVGVKFTTCSDLHAPHYEEDFFERGAELLSKFGIKDNDIVNPFKK